MAKIVYVVTDPVTARAFLRGQLAWLRGRGHEVLLISSPGHILADIASEQGISVVGIPMDREINPLNDFLALCRLIVALRRLRPDVLNSSTPKAGLLGTLAGAIARVPVRVYLLRGLRFETATGLTAKLLRSAEHVTCALAHEVVCVSASLRQRAIEEGLVSSDRAHVIATGSSNGVDHLQFHPRSTDSAEVTTVRAELGLCRGDVPPVVGFVGRLTKDKGIEDLWSAFRLVVLPQISSARLLLVGEAEPGDPVPAEVLAEIRRHPNVIQTGRFVPNTAAYYNIMSVLAFPSYREGFPNAPLEASASGVPVVAFEATGTVDAVVHSVTGTLVGPGDWHALGTEIVRYLREQDLARKHGEAGRARVIEHFSPPRIWAATEDHYVRFLQNKRIRPFSAALERLNSAISRVASSTDSKSGKKAHFPPESAHS